MDNIDWFSILVQSIISLVAGMLGGGVWIEWQRLRREKQEWARLDKRVELKAHNAIYSSARWITDNLPDYEQLRILKTGLENKIKNWQYIVSISITNTSELELLVMNIQYVFPPFDITEAEDVDEKYIREPVSSIQREYDLRSKKLLNQEDFPIAIASKSSYVITLVGIYNFDLPKLLDEPPTIANFEVFLEDKTSRQVPIIFNESSGLNIRIDEFGELDWNTLPQYEE